MIVEPIAISIPESDLRTPETGLRIPEPELQTPDIRLPASCKN